MATKGVKLRFRTSSYSQGDLNGNITLQARRLPFKIQMSRTLLLHTQIFYCKYIFIAN